MREMKGTRSIKSVRWQTCLFSKVGVSPSAQNTPRAKWPLGSVPLVAGAAGTTAGPLALVVSLPPSALTPVEQTLQRLGALPDCLTRNRGGTGCDMQGSRLSRTQSGWWPSPCGLYHDFVEGPADRRGSGQRHTSPGRDAGPGHCPGRSGWAAGSQVSIWRAL